MIQTVLFDFDGTLFDTGEGILRSVQYALEGFGIHETDTARLRKFVGPPLLDSFSELYAMTPEQAQAAVARYRERYLPVGIYECTLYPGIPELLERLRAHGFRIAVATGKPTPMARSILHMYKTFGETIASLRRAHGMRQQTLADALAEAGVPVSNQAVSKWENDATLPNAQQFLTLCRVLDVDDIAGTFSGGDAGGLLAGLNAEGRRRALEYIALLRESKRFAAAPEPAALRSLPLYSLAVSAGTGQFLDGESYEMQPVGPEVPEEANFGVRVAGDSMEPRFHSGQTVWVHQQPTLAPGEIGVFLYDGSAYLKLLRRDGGRVFLHSLNPAYADLEVSDALPLRVLGKAVS